MVIQEAELERRVGEAYFSMYDYGRKIDKIDFCVASLTKNKHQGVLFDDFSVSQNLLWAEAKKGTKQDIYESFVQLILTIGKARIYEKELPPLFLGAFDAEKIAFVEYPSISEIFNLNDFNWNVTPSNHGSKEFKQLYELIKSELEKKAYIFNYNDRDQELRAFIKSNFVLGKNSVQKILVTKNNFKTIYFRWLAEVKPTISLQWESAKKYGIIDADFYLADLLSRDNESIKETLFVLLAKDRYKIIKETKNELGLEAEFSIKFNDGQTAHRQFWERYQRPPKKEFWGYIIERRDLLVPQDVRERKGSYFTPQTWVEKSQEYLAKVLGEDWQDKYYIWDCCAGTGNLLRGLVNPYRIFASTIDKADVDVMKDQIKNGGNMLESHVFQFDFLNDSLQSEKIPADLKDLLNDQEKRKKLVIYINPPYAEADNRKGTGRRDVAETAIKNRYSDFMGYSKRELSIQFLTRIYKELNGCILGNFSTLKNIQAPRFKPFRDNYLAELKSLFIVPAYTFDNVSGDFPISFQIWDTGSHRRVPKNFPSDVFDEKGNHLEKKNILCYDGLKLINDWVKTFRLDKNQLNSIGTIIAIANDFQNQRTVRIEKPYMKVSADNHHWQIVRENLLNSCVYLSVRHCIAKTWKNNSENFLYPRDFTSDFEFQNNCLIYTLFHTKLIISVNDGVNHWIPFSELEVLPRDSYRNHFMIEFLKNRELSAEAKAVMDAARELYKYYHAQERSVPDASYYDIRVYFQGRGARGTMNNTSNDAKYARLISNLREAHKELGYVIQPKIYEYGFLVL